MKYMTVLRHFLKHINHSIDGIDNISLQLVPCIGVVIDLGKMEEYHSLSGRCELDLLRSQRRDGGKND